MSLRRSTSPCCIMLFTKLMLPIDRSGSPRCCLSALISSVKGRFTRRVFFQASGSASEFENQLREGIHSGADFIGSGRHELGECFIGGSSHDYELRWSKMIAHPTRQTRAEVTEVRRLVYARGERDEQICRELS